MQFVDEGDIHHDGHESQESMNPGLVDIVPTDHSARIGRMMMHDKSNMTVLIDYSPDCSFDFVGCIVVGCFVDNFVGYSGYTLSQQRTDFLTLRLVLLEIRTHPRLI